MNSTIVGGNSQKTSGGFSDSQKSDKFYLEYNGLVEPIHFLKNVELSQKILAEEAKNQGLSMYSVTTG